MMWCYVYRSTKKENSYLYIEREADFSSVPEPLVNAFGQPIFVMKLLLDSKRKLVAGTAEELKNIIQQNGFFLQMLKEDDFDIYAN